MVNGAVTATRKDAYAHSQYVGSEKGSPKAKSEIGPQACSENEETKSRDQEGRSRRGPTLHGELIRENEKMSAADSLQDVTVQKRTVSWRERTAN